MAFQAGYKTRILLGDFSMSPKLASFSAPVTVEVLDDTTFGDDGVKRFIPGLNGGDSVSVSGPLDVTLHSQIAAMKSAQDAGTAGFSIVYGPAGSVASQPKVSCEVYVASYEISSGVGGRVEYSASLQVDNAVTNSTW